MKTLPEETVASVAELVAADKDAPRASRFLARLPTCLFAASALVYFMLSEGMRSYAAFLHAVLVKILDHAK
jgi:hypothetical protein